METAEQTGQASISLMETRLMRAEQLLYGSSDPASEPERHNNFDHAPAVDSIASIDNEFTRVLETNRVYADLIKIYRAHPSLFGEEREGVPPTELSIEAIKQTVLAYENIIPSVASSLSAAVVDQAPLPDAALSAQLIALVPRMEALADKQKAIDDEIAELRARSEHVVRQYYEKQAMASAQIVADVETRVERAEGQVRRLEREVEEKAKVGV